MKVINMWPISRASFPPDHRQISTATLTDIISSDETMCNIDSDDMDVDDITINDKRKIINLTDLDDLIDCDKELKLNDPLLSFPLFDTPPSSSHSNSVPSSPSSMSSSSSSTAATRTSKRSCVRDSTFELCFGTDDDYSSSNDDNSKRRKKSSKQYSSNSSLHKSCSSVNDDSIIVNAKADRSNALNLKDPMMSTSHSPSHFTSDLGCMDTMFFSSHYLSPSLDDDDSIDLCSILKTEYNHDSDIMIGWRRIFVQLIVVLC